MGFTAKHMDTTSYWNLLMWALLGTGLFPKVLSVDDRTIGTYYIVARGVALHIGYAPHLPKIYRILSAERCKDEEEFRHLEVGAEEVVWVLSKVLERREEEDAVNG